MKKVLIITYYWPPSGGPGVQRVLKFVKYLPQFGWEPIVLTVEKGNYPSIDYDLINEIPVGCKVYRTKIFEPFELYSKITGKSTGEKIPTFVLNSSQHEKLSEKLSKKLRANLFVPDAKIGWIKHIVKEGEKIIAREKPDLIFSSSPPHSLQIGAMKLAQKTGLKWMADFRDPWSTAFWQNDIRRMKLAKNRDSKYEKAVLQRADAVSSVSKSIVADFENITKSNFHVLPNGYDYEDFDNITPSTSKKFIISYTGTLSKTQRIDNFLESLVKLNASLLENVEVNFYGTLHPDISASIQKSNIAGIINIHEGVAHKKIIEILMNSDMLLLVIPDTPKNEGILTGKLFEYLASRKPILGIGPKHGEAAEILTTTGCGEMFDFNEDLLPFILNEIEQKNKSVKRNFIDSEIEKFSRKNLAQNLTNIFEELL
ncbi:MAG: glycosyltransferase family 4 protein [Bacteroidetes bacterium]|nr:glycosyltransferase family 4 protein [Bacteroidota bacterium]